MTVSEFVQDLFDSCMVTPVYMTINEAADDLDNFTAEEWDLPEGITPELYAEAWNALVQEQEEQEEEDYEGI